MIYWLDKGYSFSYIEFIAEFTTLVKQCYGEFLMSVDLVKAMYALYVVGVSLIRLLDDNE